MASSRSLREQNRVPADKRNEGASLAQTRIFGREMGTGGLPRENHGGRSALQGDRPSATGAKENTAPQCPARGSKIPVLVKPHRAKPPVNFTKLHQNWEANFQKGKALKKKPCTQPMPFNLTQKGAKTTVVMETDLRRQAKGALDSNPVLPLSRVQKTPDKDKTVHDLTRNPVQANHEAHETLLATNTAHSEQPVQIIAVSPDEAVAAHSNAARCMAVAFHTNPAGMEQNGLSQHNQLQSIPFRLNQLPHVALETTINRNKAALAPHTPTHSRNQPPRATVEPRGGIEPCFPRDHKSSARCSQDVIPGLEEAAECSRGEPSASDAPKLLEHNSLDCTVPDSGDQNTSLKQRPSPTHPAPPPQKPGAAVKDGEASVEDFVPDPAALASILQNLGLKPGCAAPSGSASRAPTLGRGSMYLPQRVTMSVRAKGFDRHMTPSQANQNSHRTSVWTPQRVLQSTRKLSSMQRPCGFRGTPVQTPSQQRMAWMNAVTNKLRNANGSPCMEHVAMRLFEKPEEGDGQLDTRVNRDRDRDEVGMGEAAEDSRGEPSAFDAPKPLEHNSLDSTVPDSGDQNTSLKQRPSPAHPAPPPQKPGAAVKDGEASVEDFVPDPAALASILQNLGLKPGGAAPSGSASRAPILGRGSMYLPQRVTMSVRAKGFDRHMTPSQANQNSHRTSVWTPQRVLQSTRKLSSMQRPCGFRGTPVQTPSQQRMAWMNAVTNKLRNANGSPCMEHVAMRLFEKPEEGDGQLDTQVNRDRDRDESNTLSSHPQGQEEEGASRPLQERETTAPAFFQSVNRESVIVFSQGRRVCRQVEAQESEQAFQATNGALSPAPIRNTPAGVSQSKLVPCPSTFSETQSAPSTLSSSALRPEQALSCNSAHSGRLTTSQKEATGGPVGVRWKMAAAAPPCGSLMKQRLLVLRMQDILLDEECAFYTSRTQDQHRTAPLCRDLLNPLARTFHLQEALHFVPILQAELPAALSSAS